jgi:predicted metalloprotease with PDZ domain
VITITRLTQCKTSTQLGITIKNCKLSGQSATSLGDARIGAAIKAVQAGLSGDVAGLRPGMFIVAVDQQTVPLLSQQQIDARKKTSQEQSARLAKALIANAIRMHGKVTLTIRQ